MTNILTAAEAANFLRTESTDAVMLSLLPLVDKHIERATGRDWTKDNPVNDLAKAAAGILLVLWYDNPSQMSSDSPMPFGLQAALSQLEAEALKYRKYEIRGISSRGYIELPGARMGDQVISVTGVYGVSGDQSANFESTLRYDDCIEQLSSENLYWNLYVVILKSPADDVIP